MESSFSPLKTERRIYRTRRAARADIFDYIERSYNPIRRHSTLGYRSPINSEQQVQVGWPRVHEARYSSQRVVDKYPTARTIHLVMDNLNTPCEKSLTDHLGRRLASQLWRRVTMHFTPKHCSWLNQAEIELSLVSRECLGSRRIDTLTHLRGDTRAWNTRANRAKTRIRWQFTRKDARIKFGYQKNPSNRSKT